MRIQFIIAFAIILCNLSHAQIKMNCSGNVSVGDITPDSYKFRIQGLTKIRPGGNGTVYIDNSGYSGNPNIWGGANIGSSGNTWYTIYAEYVIPTSDAR